MRLQILLKRPKKKARTFLTDAELNKVAARTNITRPDTNDPNTMWEDIKTEITRASESVIKEIKRVLEKKHEVLVSTKSILVILEDL